MAEPNIYKIREDEFANAIEHTIRDFLRIGHIGRAQILEILRRKATEWETKKQ